MSKNNKDIGWERVNNVGSDGNYDDTLIKNQISTLNNKVNKLDEEIKEHLDEGTDVVIDSTKNNLSDICMYFSEKNDNNIVVKKK